MMGVPYKDSFIVAELIGTKLFLNEFVAYQKLSELSSNRINGLGEESISVSKCSSLDFECCQCGWATSINSWALHSEREKFHCKINIAGFCSFFFQVRSEIITTYALCGFANFSSLGIVIGGLCEYFNNRAKNINKWSCLSLSNNFWRRLFSFIKASICPSRRGDVSSLVLRAMLTGTCVSLVNACIAGKRF